MASPKVCRYISSAISDKCRQQYDHSANFEHETALYRETNGRCFYGSSFIYQRNLAVFDMRFSCYWKKEEVKNVIVRDAISEGSFGRHSHDPEARSRVYNPQPRDR